MLWRMFLCIFPRNIVEWRCFYAELSSVCAGVVSRFCFREHFPSNMDEISVKNSYLAELLKILLDDVKEFVAGSGNLQPSEQTGTMWVTRNSSIVRSFCGEIRDWIHFLGQNEQGASWWYIRACPIIVACSIKAICCSLLRDTPLLVDCSVVVDNILDVSTTVCCMIHTDIRLPCIS